MEFIQKIDVRWADLDPNFHVLHSRYYDYGAFCRMAFFVQNNFTPAIMQQHMIGPILFREECIFRREVSFGDDITINFQLTSHSPDFGRWSISHQLMKNGTTLCATINVDGAWLDLTKRKLAIPPQEVARLFELAPKSADFQVKSK